MDWMLKGRPYFALDMTIAPTISIADTGGRYIVIRFCTGVGRLDRACLTS